VLKEDDGGQGSGQKSGQRRGYTALKEWEPGQFEPGNRVLDGTHSSKARGEPLPFGLYETGDSSMP
jgi:hypothetical protein